MVGIKLLNLPDKTCPNQPKRLTDPTEVELAILQQHARHFNEARGTLFTMPLLSTLLGPSGTSEAADKIINGDIYYDDINTSDCAKRLFQQLKRKSTVKEIDYKGSPEYLSRDTANGRNKLLQRCLEFI